MGLLDPNLFTNPALLNQLKGLLGNMPIAKLMRGEEEVTREGLLGAMRAMPVFQNDAGQSAYDAAMNIGPMGLGKIVYHGSPHKFDKFDASKIGTGEGAQAYGHGVYLADAPDVAGSYAMAGRDKGISNFDSVNRMADRAFGFGGGDKVKALQYLDDEIAKTSGQSKKMNLQLAKQSIERGDHAASLYKADLPDEWIPKMLDWDKPLSEQPENVRLLAKDLGLAKDATGKDVYSALSNQARDMGIIKGRAAQTTLPGSQGRAAADLSEFGIPGIRYLDGGSRPNSGRISMLEQTIANLKGKGASQAAIANTQRELDAELARASYNYVVFPGLEDKVKILERNGVPLQGLLGGS